MRVGRRPPGAGEYTSGHPADIRAVGGRWRKAREKAEFAAVDGGLPPELIAALRILARDPPSGHVSHETHLPAEEAQASEDARFPRADEHASRPADPEAPPRQGSQALDRLMRGRPGPGRARAAAGSLGVLTSIACSATAAHMLAASSCCTCSRVAKRARPASGCPYRGRSAAPLTATASSDCCARRSRSSASRLPAGTDAVVVARTDARGLAEREGLAGIRRALGDLIARSGGSGPPVDEPGGMRLVSALRTVAVFPIRLYQRVISPAFGSRCKYYPSCSEYAAQSISRFGILRGLVLAGWRLLALQPLEPRGLRPR